MPELPEVETVVRDLRPLVVGSVIGAVQHGGQKLRKAWNLSWNVDLLGHRIAAIRRRGKWIIIELDHPKNPPRRLLVHLGMTGQLTACDSDQTRPDHLHLIFHLDGKRELRFRDPRRFGSATLFASEDDVLAFFVQARMGPEPFSVDAGYFNGLVRKTGRTLKAILLDQRVVAGVGNIYADEACFRAGLHPARLGKSLKKAEADRLRESIALVLTRAIEQRGSTIRDYIGGSGLSGGFQNEFAVYGKTGEACPTCETAIECVRLSGRSSHYCPKCQSLRRQRIK